MPGQVVPLIIVHLPLAVDRHTLVVRGQLVVSAQARVNPEERATEVLDAGKW